MNLQEASGSEESQSNKSDQETFAELERFRKLTTFLNGVIPPLLELKAFGKDLGGIRFALPGDRSFDFALYNSGVESRQQWSFLLQHARDFLEHYEPESPAAGQAEKQFAARIIEIASEARGNIDLLDLLGRVIKTTISKTTILATGEKYSEKAIGAHVIVLAQAEIEKIFSSDNEQ